MKNAFMLLGGILLATAGVLVWQSKRARPVQEMAHDLEVAWADHHTVF